ncbi:MAG: decarboxylating 6-phosphogluconate dehydrogenase [Candidatus Kaiserbacteria bacterium]|nr:decarboxylating 6-phosphogluconate dehydrogenase [Candidatus Kaiserbacteria bacterium]MCB9816061.1 decarboxylating 6-phosphogluconate dehydrogenase [Candidatus Nomurabacteria bacterium]
MEKELIFIGLGRMGLAMTAHLVAEGFVVHGFDVTEASRQEAAKAGVQVQATLTDTLAQMSEKKIVWLMVPSKFVDEVITEMKPLLKSGDIVIDGGNSFFKDTLRRGEALAKDDIHFVDCGTSGGMRGARHGAALMVGGPKDVVSEIEPIFTTLAIENGYAHVGKTGAGHFVKMVHNGIEYGMMGAIAEGLSYIEDRQEEFDIDIQKVLDPYQHGSIVTSSLMDWMADSYRTEGYLEAIAGEVPRGETEEEMEYIIEAGKTPVLEASVEQRKATRGNPSRIGTLLSAMRNQFGGHAVVKKEEK